MLSWLKCGFISNWPPLAALGWTGIAFLVGPVSWMLSLLLLTTTDFAKYLLVLYLLWMYLDRESRINKTRRWKWLRGLRWWERHRDYFPMRLVKTCDLPRDRNYLFAVYPHGVFSYGIMTLFLTNVLSFKEKFPGLKRFLCTLNIVFRLPIVREFALGMGFSSVSKECLNELLSGSEKGRAVAVVVGGAAEAALSKPSQYKILLNRRKGFCKIALDNGCDIVPVYCFGESDLFELHEPEEGSMLDKFQLWFKKITTVLPVVFRGVGLFGIFPRKVPLTMVVGSPIQVKKVEGASDEEIEELHSEYKRNILRLFNQHKEKYLKNKNAELVIC